MYATAAMDEPPEDAAYAVTLAAWRYHQAESIWAILDGSRYTKPTKKVEGQLLAANAWEVLEIFIEACEAESDMMGVFSSYATCAAV